MIHVPGTRWSKLSVLRECDVNWECPLRPRRSVRVVEGPRPAFRRWWGGRNLQSAHRGGRPEHIGLERTHRTVWVCGPRSGLRRHTREKPPAASQQGSFRDPRSPACGRGGHGPARHALSAGSEHRDVKDGHGTSLHGTGVPTAAWRRLITAVRAPHTC